MTMREREALKRANAALRRRRIEHARQIRRDAPTLPWADWAFLAVSIAFGLGVLATIVWGVLGHA